MKNLLSFQKFNLNEKKSNSSLKDLKKDLEEQLDCVQDSYDYEDGALEEMVKSAVEELVKKYPEHEKQIKKIMGKMEKLGKLYSELADNEEEYYDLGDYDKCEKACEKEYDKIKQLIEKL